MGLNKIESHVAMGRLPSAGSGEDGAITMRDLLDSGVVTKIKHGVKVSEGRGNTTAVGQKLASYTFLLCRCLFLVGSSWRPTK